MLNRSYVNISYQFLYHYASCGRLKDLAILCKLKSVHRSGTFYNFSYNNLSEVSSISRTALRGALPRLIRDGYIEIRDGNLTLRKQKRVANTLGISHLRNTEVDITKDVRGLVEEFRQILLANESHRKDYTVRKLGNDQSLQENNMFYGESCYADTDNNSFQRSYESLACLWGCSKTSAYYQMKKWIGEGFFLKKRMYNKTPFCGSLLDEVSNGDPTFFIVDGKVCKQRPNLYTYVL